MEDSEKIIIKDSCILFDLIDLDLISHFFDIGWNVHTTLYVISEITDEQQLREINKYSLEGKLIVDTQGEHDTIEQIYNECKGLSLADCSVLELAIRKGGVVLSSDKALRNEITRRNFTVRGLLWVIDQLLLKEILTVEQALEKLDLYPEVNKRAPIKEIEVFKSRLNESSHN